MLSIITNFGCHYKCPYCILKKNGLDIPKTTINGLNELDNILNDYNEKTISISGGGDPLHQYNMHNDYYNKLFKILDKHNKGLELHTSYIDKYSSFPRSKCERIVYHCSSISDMCKIKKIGKEIIRIVFVVNETFTEKYISKIQQMFKIAKMIGWYDELTFRQMVDEYYETKFYCHEYLIYGHENGLWHYVQQEDYNNYYINGRLYDKFSDFKRGSQNEKL